MKKINILIFVFVFTTIASAQQFPLQSQYQFNYSVINPAVTGENNFYRVRASFREQWRGFIQDNTISTQVLTVTKGFDENGLGFTVFSDQTGGAFNKSGASISFSHKVKFEESDLYFGVSAGLSKINLGLIDDPAILLTEGTIPEFNFGVYYTVNNINLGFSIPGLLNSDMKLTGSLENTIDRHYYTMISYKKQLNDDWSMYPSMLIKNTDNHQQVDANINFKLRNKLWFGTSYRQILAQLYMLVLILEIIISIFS